MLRRTYPLLVAGLALGVGGAAWSGKTAMADAPDVPDVPDTRALRKLSARLVPVRLQADLRGLTENERAALTKILQAARIMDPLFLAQVWPGTLSTLLELSQDQTPLGRARLHAFVQNKGPWLRLDHDRPFLPEVGEKPPQAGYYPAGTSKAEIEAWLAKLGPKERQTAMGFFTTIRRDGQGSFVAVPYSLEYQPQLEIAARLLREAAALTSAPTLRDFLEKRAAAFTSNDYYDSDVAWMKLDAAIEPTIGPYEVYEDGWFNAKAAFEAFVTIRDDAETAKLQKFAAELQDIENHLPIDPKWRNPKLGTMAPIRVVNSIFSSGDANRGVQTAAFNLPNDERIAKQMGTKRTMLKNVQEAKFEKILRPISRIALAPKDRNQVSFEAFFTHILMHELMHGLGPHETKVGKTTTVRAALKENYSAIEEAKADISGLFALQYLVDKGVIEKRLEKTMYTTFLASTFRSIRFGLGEAHGKGIAVQLNTLLDGGAVTVAKDGTFSIDAEKAKAVVTRLTGELLTLQAEGDAKGAAALLEKKAVLRPEVKRVLDRLEHLPIDIEPIYATAEALLAKARKPAAPAARKSATKAAPKTGGTRQGAAKL